jgi:hypothetical protein
MKNETSEILMMITVIAIFIIGLIVIFGIHLMGEIRQIRTYQQETQYYHIEQLDCYCRVDHIGKQDVFIDVKGDTVAVVKRK